MTHVRSTLALLLGGLLAACATSPSAPTQESGVTRAPTLRATALDGTTVDLAAALDSGRTVVLVFWQTWCASCLAEAPQLAAAARAHADELFFVGIVPGPDGTVDEAELERLVRRFDLPYPQVRDRDLEWSKAFRITGTPTLIALRADGSAGWRDHRPPADWLALHRQLRAPRALGSSTPAAEKPPNATPATSPSLVIRERALGGIMGSTLEIRVIGPDPAALDVALDAAVAEMRRIEDLMTDWRPSPLENLNAAAGQGPRIVPPEIADIVQLSLEVGALTDGAFDITFASVGKLWDFKTKPPRVPAAEDIARQLAFVGYARVKVDLKTSTVELPQGMRLGLGGIAQGYGADRAMAVLMSHGVQHAIVNVSGDLNVLGTKFGKPWEIAIVHPRDTERVIAIVPLSNTCLETSGDYERGFEIDGKRYHHILDPRTGWPSDGCMSATVIAPDAALADALGTGMCVMGWEKGLAIIERLPRVEALLVDMSGVVHASSGLLPHVR